MADDFAPRRPRWLGPWHLKRFPDGSTIWRRRYDAGGFPYSVFGPWVEATND